MAGAMRYEAILDRPQSAGRGGIGIISGPSGSRFCWAGMRMELTLPTMGEVLILEQLRTVVMPGVQADTVPENAAPG